MEPSKGRFRRVQVSTQEGDSVTSAAGPPLDFFLTFFPGIKGLRFRDSRKGFSLEFRVWG